MNSIELNRKEFSNKVYEIVMDIPLGCVATYGMIAFDCILINEDEIEEKGGFQKFCELRKASTD